LSLVTMYMRVTLRTTEVTITAVHQSTIQLYAFLHFVIDRCGYDVFGRPERNIDRDC